MIRTRDDKVHAWYPGSVMHDGASQEAPSLFVFSCFILSRRNGFEPAPHPADSRYHKLPITGPRVY